MKLLIAISRLRQQKKILLAAFGISLMVYIILVYKLGIISNSVRSPNLFKPNNTIAESGDSFIEHVTTRRHSLFKPNITIPKRGDSFAEHVTTQRQNAGKNVVLQNISYPLTIYNNSFIIPNRNICQGVKNLLYLVVVHSSTIHFERRKSFRETWANIDKKYTIYNTRLVFLLGKPQNDSTQKTIRKENECFGDIVQGNFMDSYHNLTHKAVLGLRWVTENCRQARFIVKVDDDVFVNVFKLISIITENANKSRTIFCDVRPKGKINRGGKWKVDKREFAGLKYWPYPFCAGFFVILTSDVIPELYEKAKISSFLWLDDVYLFGLLASKIGNVTHIKLNDITLERKDSLLCFNSKGKNCPLLAANTQSRKDMQRFWAISLNQRNQYPNITINTVTSVVNKTCYS